MRKTITQAKKNIYFSNQFTRHVGNGQKTWQTIDNALNRKPPKSTPDTISIDSKLCTNKKDIANEYNNYFATICANNQIPYINTHYTSYLYTPLESTFNFEHIDNATTMHHLSKLTPSHSWIDQTDSVQIGNPFVDTSLWHKMTSRILRSSKLQKCPSKFWQD